LPSYLIQSDGAPLLTSIFWATVGASSTQVEYSVGSSRELFSHAGCTSKWAVNRKARGTKHGSATHSLVCRTARLAVLFVFEPVWYSDRAANKAPSFYPSNTAVEESKPLVLSKSSESAIQVDQADYVGVRRRARLLRRSLRILELRSPHLLDAIEKARLQDQPVRVAVEGYEHLPEVAMALLCCAHAYGVTLTFVPLPEEP
jgi:hypothetical protein